MKISFYKPNPRNTRHACSFLYAADKQAFYCSMVKQFDTSGKTGTFFGNKDNPDASVSLKLSPAEVGSMIDTFESGTRPTTQYHDSERQKLQISLKPYEREGVQIGFSFGVTKTIKDTGAKASFLIGFTFGEAVTLREFLKSCLQKHFRNSQNNPKSLENQQPEPDNVSSEASPAPSGDPSAGDIPW